jgi:ATP-dependent helicase HrpB
LAEQTQVAVDRQRAGEVLAAAAARDPQRAARPASEVDSFLHRVAFVQRWMPEIGLPSDCDAFLRDAVVSLCAGRRSFSELRAADLMGALRDRLRRDQLVRLEREAPARYLLPRGRSVAITYAADKPPAAAVRIQDLFGVRETPRLAGGRVAMVLQLLAPNQRPVQITDDLESFWRNTYTEVRKVLRGRYPKHAWPEDPVNAKPVSRGGVRSS